VADPDSDSDSDSDSSPNPDPDATAGHDPADRTADRQPSGGNDCRIRHAVPADAVRLRVLQAELASPWPELLDAALGPGSRSPPPRTAPPIGAGPTCLVAALPGRPDGEPAPRTGDRGGNERLDPAVGPPDRAGAGSAGASRGSPPSPDRVVGYALALDGPERLLVELVVAPGHRRRGYGRALVAALADRPLRVTVRADDENALAFYRSLGFERVDALPAFYDLPDGARDGVALRLGLE